MFFHVPFFLSPFSEHDPYPQKYLIAKIGIDTAENGPSEVDTADTAEIFALGGHGGAVLGFHLHLADGGGTGRG